MYSYLCCFLNRKSREKDRQKNVSNILMTKHVFSQQDTSEGSHTDRPHFDRTHSDRENKQPVTEQPRSIKHSGKEVRLNNI